VINSSYAVFREVEFIVGHTSVYHCLGDAPSSRELGDMTGKHTAIDRLAVDVLPV
jgi:hypothetical protein